MILLISRTNHPKQQDIDNYLLETDIGETNDDIIEKNLKKRFKIRIIHSECFNKEGDSDYDHVTPVTQNTEC